MLGTYSPSSSSGCATFHDLVKIWSIGRRVSPSYSGNMMTSRCALRVPIFSEKVDVLACSAMDAAKQDDPLR